MLEETPIQEIPVEQEKEFWTVSLIGKEVAAEGTMTFIFAKPPGYKFNAGQYVDIQLINPPETDEKGTTRHFTLACSPADNDLRITTRMRDSAMKRILADMQIGTPVNIGKPKGSFALHEDKTQTAVFLAGGVGITAPYSIIKDAIENKTEVEIILIYSNKRPEDAPFMAELEQLSEQYEDFTFIPTMTEADRSLVGWTGERSYIDQKMLEMYVPNPQKLAMYYVSGPPGMISVVRALLIDWGVEETNIKVEEYTGYE